MKAKYRIFASLLLACAALAEGAEWNVTDHIPLSKFIVQSHRGAGVLAPENTIEAFELGWKLGTIPEADLRTTRDKVIVAFHDADFKRVVKGASPELQKKGVIDLTFDELSKLDVGAWAGDRFEGRRVSRINEVFDVMRDKPDRRLYLDIKNVDLQQLADDVNARKLGRQVILASPDHDVIRRWKALVPDSDTLLWFPGDEAKMREKLSAVRQADFEGITQIQLHIHPNKNPGAADPFRQSNAFIRAVGDELRTRGILFQTLAYTPDRSVYAKLLDLGVMSFSTDYPDVAWEEIRAYYTAKGKR